MCRSMHSDELRDRRGMRQQRALRFALVHERLDLSVGLSLQHGWGLGR